MRLVNFFRTTFENIESTRFVGSIALFYIRLFLST